MQLHSQEVNSGSIPRLWPYANDATDDGDVYGWARRLNGMALSCGPEMHVPPVPPSPSTYNAPGPLSSPGSLKHPADWSSKEYWYWDLVDSAWFLPCLWQAEHQLSAVWTVAYLSGIYELSDIVVLDVNQLQELVPHLNFGIANRLVTNAQEDYPMHKHTRLDWYC